MLAPGQVSVRFLFSQLFSNSLIIHEAHIWAHRVQCVNVVTVVTYFSLLLSQECQLLVLNSSAQVISRAVLHPSVEADGYIVKVCTALYALWSVSIGLNGSPSQSVCQWQSGS